MKKDKVITIIVPRNGLIVNYYGLDDLKTSDIKEIIRALSSVVQYRRDNESKKSN